MLSKQQISRLVGILLLATLIPFVFQNVLADSKKYAGTKLVILSGPDGDPPVTRPYIQQFEKETGIKVEFTEIALGPLHSKLATLFAARSPEVDIVWTYVGWTAEFAAAGYLEDITKWIDPELKADLNPAINCVSYKGKIYGLPRFLSIRNFLYNKRMFKEAGLDPNKPPRTWDEFVEAAKKLTRDTDGDGKIDQWGVLNQYGSPDSCFLTYQEILIPAGGTMFDYKDNPVFDSPEAILALEKLQELHRLGVVDPASFGIASGPDKRARFVQGYDAMEFGWAADYTLSNDPKVSKVVGEVAFALIPGIKLESGAMEGSEGFAISKFSKNKKAAFEFLKFQARKEIQMDMCLRTGWMPVRTSVFASPALRQANPLVAHVEQQMKYRVYRFGAPYATEVINAFGPEILKVVKLEKDPQQAIADAVKAAREIVKRYK
ncbi:MAG: sugar ABC transporter substrate-binding protein [Firmicutes bacterium]|nr:sugar ABC transporter substrate-binding protein [Bacillota bacterium]